MARVLALLVWFTSFARAQGEVAWHVEVSLRETVSTRSKPPGDLHNTEDHSAATASAQFAVDALALPELGDSGIRVTLNRATVTSLTGTYSRTSAGSTHNQYEEGSSNSTETASATDRSGVSLDFAFHRDDDWQLDAGATFDGSGSGTTCTQNKLLHEPKRCDPSSGGFNAGIVARASASTHGTLRHAGRGFRVDATIDDRSASDPSRGYEEVHHLEIHATLTPDDTVYEAVIHPVRRDEYHRWIPEGPKPGGRDDDGNELQVFLEIRDRKTHAPAKVQFSAVYTLASSHVPGWSMNTPALPKQLPPPPPEPDLFFKPTAKGAAKQVSTDGSTLTSTGAIGDDLVTVSSRDWGGYATLSARVTVEGKAFQARFTDDHGVATDDPFRIPEDANDNHVADAWEKAKDVDVFAKNLKAGDDREDRPTSQATRGDGYTLYEEYRGFWLDDPTALDAWLRGKGKRRAAHRRLDPKTKQLLVIPSGDVIPLLIRGALLWSRTTGIDVFVVPSNDQLAPWPETDTRIDPVAHPRWADFNIDPAHPEEFGEHMVAVRLMSDGMHGGVAFSPPVGDVQSLGNPTRANHMAPKSSLGVMVTASRAQKQIRDWIWMLEHKSYSALERGLVQLGPDRGGDRMQILAYAKQHAPELVERYMVFTVMHELGHNTGTAEHSVIELLDDPRDPAKAANDAEADKIQDALNGDYLPRGDRACPQRYWQYDHEGLPILKLLAGSWNPEKTNPDGGEWKYCDEPGRSDNNRGMIRLRQKDGQEWEAFPDQP